MNDDNAKAEAEVLAVLERAVELLRAGRAEAVSVSCVCDRTRDVEVYGGTYDVRGRIFHDPRLQVSVTEKEDGAIGLASFSRIAKAEMRAAGVPEYAVRNQLIDLDRQVGIIQRLIAKAPIVRREAQVNAARVEKDWRPR